MDTIIPVLVVIISLVLALAAYAAYIRWFMRHPDHCQVPNFSGVELVESTPPSPSPAI